MLPPKNSCTLAIGDAHKSALGSIFVRAKKKTNKKTKSTPRFANQRIGGGKVGFVHSAEYDTKESGR